MGTIGNGVALGGADFNSSESEGSSPFANTFSISSPTEPVRFTGYHGSDWDYVLYAQDKSVVATNWAPPDYRVPASSDDLVIGGTNQPSFNVTISQALGIAGETHAADSLGIAAANALTDNAATLYLGSGATNNGYALVNNGNAYFNSGTALVVNGGNVANAGEIVLTNAAFEISGDISLSGGGTVDMIGGAIRGATSTSVGTLENSATIEGSGVIGSSNDPLVLHNQAGGYIIGTEGTAALIIQTRFTSGANALVNDGVIEDTGAGGVAIYYTLIKQPDGVIGAFGTGASVTLGAVTVEGGELATSGGGVIKIAHVNGSLDNATLDGSTTEGAVTNAGTFIVNDSTTLKGAIHNTGLFEDETVILVAEGGATLSGGGQIALGNGGDTQSLIKGGSTVASTLYNIDNTISGAGLFGGNLIFDNEVGGVVDATHPGISNYNFALEFENMTVGNAGLMEDTDSLINLYLVNDTVIQSGGTIGAFGNGTKVDLRDTTIEGGTLATSGGGIIATYQGGATLDGSTPAGSLTNAGTAAGGLTLKGAIRNTGLLEDTSTFLIAADGATLSGGGQLLLGNGGDTQSLVKGGGTAASTLYNIDNTISGAGQIGGNLDFVNEAGGIVDATHPGNYNYHFSLDLVDMTIGNAGLIEDTGSITSLDILGGVVAQYGGTIGAFGEGAIVTLGSVTVEGGVLATSGGGIIEVSGINGAVDHATLDGGTAAGAVTNAGTLLDNHSLILAGVVDNTGLITGVGKLIVNGTLVDSGSVTASGSVTDNGTIELSDGGVLDLFAGADGSGTIAFTASGQFLQIGTAGAAATLGNAITGFDFGDTIDLAGVGLETGFDYTNGVLTLSGGSQPVQLTLATAGVANGFDLADDGNGGTLLTLSTSVTRDWNNPAGGDWNSAGNWSPGGVPAAGDSVVLGGTGAYTVTVASPIAAVKAIAIDNAQATLSVLDPDVTQSVTGDLDNGGILELDQSGAGGSALAIGGTLDNTGDVFIGSSTIAAATTVTAAALVNSGNILLAGGTAGAVLDIAGTAPDAFSGSLLLVGEAEAQFGSGGIATIAADGGIALDGADAIVTIAGTPGSDSALAGLSEIDGSLVLSGGASAATTGALLNTGFLGIGGIGGGGLGIGGGLENSGSIELVVGSAAGHAEFTIAGAADNSGEITIGALDALQVTDGNAFTQSAGRTTVAGSLSAATVAIEGGILKVDPGASFDAAIDGGGGAMLDLAAGASTGTLGNFNGFGNVTVEAAADWQLSDFTGVGSIVAYGTLELGDLAFGAAEAIDVGTTGRVEFGGAVGGGEISFLGAGGRIDIADPAHFAGAAYITGFATGDVIDLTKTAANGEKFAGGVLTLTDNGAVVAEIGLSTQADNPVFVLSADGGGGTEVMLHEGPLNVFSGSYPNGITLGSKSTQNPATITATGYIGNSGGVAVLGTAGFAWNVTNLGVVEGSAAGIELTHGGIVTNGAADPAGGYIAGGYGVEINGGRGTVVNFGTIAGSGTSGVGVALEAGGTLDNFGTVSGAGGTAVLFAGAGELLIDHPGAVFDGDVVGGGKAAIKLARGGAAGTLSGLGTVFTGFDRLTVQHGAVWRMSGDDAGITVFNKGTIEVIAGDRLTLGSVAAQGVVEIASGGEAALDDAVAIGQKFVFADATGTLGLAKPRAFNGTIAGFQAGDVIDFFGKTATRFGFSNHHLHVFDGKTLLGSLHLAGRYTKSSFALQSDGHGGTEIVGQPAAASGPPEFLAGLGAAPPDFWTLPG